MTGLIFGGWPCLYISITSDQVHRRGRILVRSSPHIRDFWAGTTTSADFGLLQLRNLNTTQTVISKIFKPLLSCKRPRSAHHPHHSVQAGLGKLQLHSWEHNERSKRRGVQVLLNPTSFFKRHLETQQGIETEKNTIFTQTRTNCPGKASEIEVGNKTKCTWHAGRNLWTFTTEISRKHQKWQESTRICQWVPWQGGVTGVKQVNGWTD